MTYVLDKAGKALAEEGLLPSSTRAYHIVNETNRPVKLVIEKYLTDAEYARFLQVMSENWAASKVMV